MHSGAGSNPGASGRHLMLASTVSVSDEDVYSEPESDRESERRERACERHEVAPLRPERAELCARCCARRRGERILDLELQARPSSSGVAPPAVSAGGVGGRVMFTCCGIHLNSATQFARASPLPVGGTCGGFHHTRARCERTINIQPSRSRPAGGGGASRGGRAPVVCSGREGRARRDS